MMQFLIRLAVGYGFLSVVLAGQVPAREAGPQPRAAYPKPFSRPPSMGEDYDTWRGATGPDVGEVEVDAGRLPSRVDNSARPEFPPVYKQRWGACGQFTAIASIFTYEMNVLNGVVADTKARRFPAHFSWNMMNGADNRGSEAYHGWEVARLVGIPTALSYGGVRLDTIGPWPDGYSVWREAMEYRVAGYRYSPAVTVRQLDEARGWLYDRNRPTEGGGAIGGLLAMDGRMGERDKVTKTIPEGQHRAGEDLWIRWGPSGYGHGLTCVGYDDGVGYDVNGDGAITNDVDTDGDGKITLADWERGAYIVVNSWGENWANDGRIYLLYSAMIDPTWERGNYLGRIEVARRVPSHTLKLKLSCSDRSSLRVTVGIAGDEGAARPEHEFAPELLNGWPLFGKGTKAGDVPIAGPGNAKPLEIGIDLTPLLRMSGPNTDGAGRIFARFDRAAESNLAGELHECSIRTYNHQGELVDERKVGARNGKFGEKPLEVEAPIGRLPIGDQS